MTSNDFNIVLNFWFGLKSDNDYLQDKSFWFATNASDDELVDKHLGEYYRKARNGQLDFWFDLGNGEGALALIILLDQVPRNIFRNKPLAYETDFKALGFAKSVVNKGWDKDMNNIFRRFIYAPFHHSERLEDQEICLKLSKQLQISGFSKYAQINYDLIKQFGRFPHRDQVLRRNN